jgi:hypothetical protein
VSEREREIEKDINEDNLKKILEGRGRKDKNLLSPFFFLYLYVSPSGDRKSEQERERERENKKQGLYDSKTRRKNERENFLFHHLFSYSAVSLSCLPLLLNVIYLSRSLSPSLLLTLPC